MKIASVALVMAGMVAAIAANVSAQATRPVAKPVLQAKIDEMKEVIKLSDEQAKKMTDLFDETEKAKKALAEEFKTVQADYDKAFTSDDKAALKTATEKWTALWNKQTEINKKGSGDLNGVLTAEQKAQWLEHKYLTPTLKYYERLGITDDQLTKICGEFRKLVAEGDPENDMMFRYQLFGKVRNVMEKEILTDEQRRKLVLDPLLKQYKAAKLTDAQVSKATEETVTLIKAMGENDNLMLVSMKVRKVLDDSLTPEQREEILLTPMLNYYKRADLTADQETKVREKYRALAKDAKKDDPPWTMGMKVSEFIMKDVLTDEQKTKMGFKPASN